MCIILISKNDLTLKHISYHAGIDFQLHSIVLVAHGQQTSFGHEFHFYIFALVVQCLELFGRNYHDLFVFVRLRHDYLLKYINVKNQSSY